MLGHGYGHDTDRSSAGDQDILTQDIEGQGRMDRITKRIEAADDVEGNLRIAVPDIGDRNRQVFGKSAGPVDPHATGLIA